MDSPFSRLLLATEHDEFDAGAEGLALALARHCVQPLQVVLPITTNPEYEAVAPQLAEKTEARAAVALRALADAAARASVTVQLRARRGPEPAREILAEAAERGSDLLVIRRRGRRSFLDRLLLGRMVRQVVVHAPCSVLVAPRAARLWTRGVLAAWDPAGADTTPLAVAAAIAARCKLPLTVVCVGPLSPAALERAGAAAQACGVSARVLRRDGRPHEEILETARETGADLLVIGRRGEDNLLHAWLGGVAQKVIGLAEIPVLVAVGPQPRQEIEG